MSRPLAGRRVLVTRRPEQSRTLTSRLREAGAEVLELPLIEIQPPEACGPLDAALARLHNYDWLAFTSANAVRAVANRLAALGLAGASVGQGIAVASVGAATSKAFREAFPNGRVALEPAVEFRAEALLAAFRSRGVSGERFLLPVSDRGREVLADGLREAGARVASVVAYRTRPAPDLAARLPGILKNGFDIAVFASPSAVASFVAAAGASGRAFPAAVIGPVTREAAEAGGLDVRVVAGVASAEGLLAALVAYFDRSSLTGGS